MLPDSWEKQHRLLQLCEVSRLEQAFQHACCSLGEGRGPGKPPRLLGDLGHSHRNHLEGITQAPHVTEKRPREGRGVAQGQHASDFAGWAPAGTTKTLSSLPA